MLEIRTGYQAMRSVVNSIIHKRGPTNIANMASIFNGRHDPANFSALKAHRITFIKSGIFRSLSQVRKISIKSKPSNQQLHGIRTATSSPNFSCGYPTPGPQEPNPQSVMDHKFFVSKTEWKKIREEEKFDFMVVGSSFASLAFVEKVLAINAHARILILERGPFFLPEHFQNLPVPYQKVLGGLSETFPWTVSEKTWNSKYIKWLHGSVPFFGGRSIMWSGWCPRPTESEMSGWPKKTIAAAFRHFKEAEELLNVLPANLIDRADEGIIKKQRPVLGELQDQLFDLLKNNLHKIPSATRVMHAPLAVDGRNQNIDFVKFAVPGSMFKLIDRQKALAAIGKGAEIKIATECVVKRVLEQNNKAVALETSRGVVALGNAKLILAMGALPATTLVLNSFPQAVNAGKRFTAHFISSIIARIPREHFEFAENLGDLEIAAIYFAGVDPKKGQYHIQLTALSDRDPEKNAENAARHMPDVVATASPEQLKDSKDYVVFVGAVLGEIHSKNKNNWFRRNNDADVTTNVTLQVIESEADSLTWETMDEGTFQALEQVLSPKGPTQVEYWHPDLSGIGGSWQKGQRPSRAQIRVPGLVHEGSTMHIGEDLDPSAVVNLDYRLKGVENVYVTGSSLWPKSGSWNPTLTMTALARDLATQLVKDKKN